MKKTYLDFKHRLPIIRSHRLFGGCSEGEYMSAQYRSGDRGEDDDDDDDDADEASKLMVRMKKLVRRELASRAADKATTEAVIAEMQVFLSKDKDGKLNFPIEALREMADPDKGVMKALTAQGLEIQALRASAGTKPKDLSMRAQIAAYFAANAETIKAIRGGTQRDMPPFEIQLAQRAADPMTAASVMPNGSLFISSSAVQPGIIGDMRAEPTFWDFIPKRQTSVETYYWVNKIPTTGEAAWLSPGDYKPPIKFSFETELSKAKKIAVSAKAPLELFEDIDGFESWVETELRYALYDKVNTTLMDNVETSTEPSGIKQLSIPYEPLTGVHTTNPTIWDAIVAATTMLRVTRFRGRIIAFMNPVDYTNAVITKANTQGQLFIPPATGATIVQDLNMPLGYFNVVAIDYYKLLIYKAFRIAWGWENDDFTRNMNTAIAEMRLHQFHSANHDGFSIYDSIANVIAAIQEV